MNPVQGDSEDIDLSWGPEGDTAPALGIEETLSAWGL